MSQHPYLFDMPEAAPPPSQANCHRYVLLAHVQQELVTAGIDTSSAYKVVEAIRAGRIPSLVLLANEMRGKV